MEVRRFAAGGPAGLVVALLVALVGASPAESRSAGAFSLGVASGEVTARSAKIWGHAERAGHLRAELARDRRFRRLVSSVGLEARRRNDLTVQRRLRGLRPAARYWYRFCRRKRCSGKGTFRTAPRRGKTRPVKFALSGDADATARPGESEPFFGDYQVFEAMRHERNNFNVFIGDTIYSDTGVDGPPALTAKQKWVKYAEALRLRNYRKLRRSAPLYNHWDDHEFINDFSISENGRRLYDAGVRAFRDYTPVIYGQRNGLYRTFRWGKNVEIFFLDERSFRDAKASAGGRCDNPDTDAPDLAPTAPEGKRALFAALIPSLARPVSPACKATINDPERTLLGRRQFRRFVGDLEASKARWKLIMNETPIQQFYGLPYDRWEGYAYERVELLDRLQRAGIDDVVFFTTDTHAAFANVVRERTFADDIAPSNAPAAPTDTPFEDFVIGPVATNTFWAEIDAVTGNEGNGRLLSNAFFKPPPPDGVGMRCAQGDEYSYAQVTAGRKRLRVAYKTAAGETVADVDETPCGPYVLRR